MSRNHNPSGISGKRRAQLQAIGYCYTKSFFDGALHRFVDLMAPVPLEQRAYESEQYRYQVHTRRLELIVKGEYKITPEFRRIDAGGGYVKMIEMLQDVLVNGKLEGEDKVSLSPEERKVLKEEWGAQVCYVDKVLAGMQPKYQESWGLRKPYELLYKELELDIGERTRLLNDSDSYQRLLNDFGSFEERVGRLVDTVFPIGQNLLQKHETLKAFNAVLTVMEQPVIKEWRLENRDNFKSILVKGLKKAYPKEHDILGAFLADVESEISLEKDNVLKIFKNNNFLLPMLIPVVLGYSFPPSLLEVYEERLTKNLSPVKENAGIAR